jgi:hypothetical protein
MTTQQKFRRGNGKTPSSKPKMEVHLETDANGNQWMKELTNERFEKYYQVSFICFVFLISQKTGEHNLDAELDVYGGMVQIFAGCQGTSADHIQACRQ